MYRTACALIRVSFREHLRPTSNSMATHFIQANQLATRQSVCSMPVRNESRLPVTRTISGCRRLFGHDSIGSVLSDTGYLVYSDSLADSRRNPTRPSTATAPGPRLIPSSFATWPSSSLSTPIPWSSPSPPRTRRSAAVTDLVSSSSPSSSSSLLPKSSGSPTSSANGSSSSILIRVLASVVDGLLRASRLLCRRDGRRLRRDPVPVPVPVPRTSALSPSFDSSSEEDESVLLLLLLAPSLLSCRSRYEEKSRPKRSGPSVAVSMLVLPLKPAAGA